MRHERVDSVRWSWLVRMAATMVAVVTAAEWLHWRASRQVFPKALSRTDGRTEAVVVLGFPIKRDGHTHPLQRWRCRIAVRSMDSRREGVIVFTGGAIKRDQAEAEAMARYTHESLGVPEERIRTETKAESTWQNIEFSIPLIEHADRITIASDPMHAARARRYLRLQRPDLAARLAPAADYRFLEAWWLKIPTATHELAAIARRTAGRFIRRPSPHRAASAR
ncbi:YdcF family protein [Nocardia sp. NPDC051570]|uniref:YdcF family protein n=1 Tax=Nocardia sp. NPDC051570 TaxID=3364324 RepID=UPI0037B46D2F